jgi:Domain of unknown function (DUF6457)
MPVGENRGVDAWLRDARDVIAAVAGLPAVELELDEDEVRTLLDLARIAAHKSGDRTNAPVLCYLIGLAVQRGSADLGIIAEAVRGPDQ